MAGSETKIIRIFDTTLRDGEQSPGASMNVEEKVMVAKQLGRLEVDIIEAGFAYSSPGDFEAVRRIAHEVEGVFAVDDIQQFLRNALDARTQGLDHAWGECLADQRPQTRVFGRIGAQHGLGLSRRVCQANIAQWPAASLSEVLRKPGLPYERLHILIAR